MERLRTQKSPMNSHSFNFKNRKKRFLFDITTLYYNTQILKHQLDFLESNLTNTQKLLKNMELLKEQLLAKRTDVSKVKLQAEQLGTQRKIPTTNTFQF